MDDCSDDTQCAGGAIPKALSFSLPAAVIQSVVHAGDNCVRILIFSTPNDCSACSILSAITCVAGQPEYVGVIITSHVSSSCHLSSRTIPKSTTETAGISGSLTVDRHCHNCSEVNVTMQHPGRHAEGIASLRANNQDARYGDLAYRPAASTRLWTA